MLYEVITENAFALELEKAGAITMVAVIEKNVVGFVNAQLVIDELYINNIAVTRQCRKRGIGELLLKELERKVFGIATFVTLEVRLSNDLAQSLYKKCGYEIVGVRKNFYQNPTEDAVLMTLTL